MGPGYTNMPWSCDCHLSWFRGWSQRSPDVLKCKKERAQPQVCPLCSTPSHLKHKELQELEELVCTAPVISSTHRNSVPEDLESEVTPSEEFRPALGNVSLGLTDEHGNKVDLDCSVAEPEGSTRASWSQAIPGSVIRANVSFSVDLECPMDRGSYERLWRLIAYYSDTPAHLQREIMLGKEPDLSYRYRQDPEKDALYFTGVRASVRARPDWVMQPELDLQLNRRRSTGKLVRLQLSARTSQVLEQQEARSQNRDWVLIQNHNLTRTALTVVVGQPVQLDCIVTSSGDPMVAWVLPNGSRVEAPFRAADGRLAVSESGELSIHTAAHGDAGLYYCVAHVGGDFSVLPFRLVVEESSSPPPGGEGVAGPVAGLAAERVTLPCDASGSPDPELHWILPDGRVLTPRSSDTPTRALLAPNGTLVLSQGQLSDNGYYKCVAISAHGVDALSTKLTLSRRPGRPLQRPAGRPQGARRVSTHVKAPESRGKVEEKKEEEEASGDSSVQEAEEIPVTPPGVTPVEDLPPRRRVPQGGVRGGHPSRNSWRRPGMQRKPIRPSSHGSERGGTVDPRRRVGLSNNQVDPERWANILAKVRDRTKSTTLSPSPTTKDKLTTTSALESEATDTITDEPTDNITEEEEEEEAATTDPTPQTHTSTTDSPEDYPEEDQFEEEPTTPEPSTESPVDHTSSPSLVPTVTPTTEPTVDLDDTEDVTPDPTTEPPTDLDDLEDLPPEPTTESPVEEPDDETPEPTTDLPLDYDEEEDPTPDPTTETPVDLDDPEDLTLDPTTEPPLDIRSLYSEEQTHVIYQISAPDTDTDTDLFTESTHTLQRGHTLQVTQRPLLATSPATDDVINSSPIDDEDLPDEEEVDDVTTETTTAQGTQWRRTHWGQGRRKHTHQEKDTHTTPARDRHTPLARDRHTPQGRNRQTTPAKDTHTTQARGRHTTLAKDTHTTQARDQHTTQARDRHTPQGRDRHTTLAKDTHTTQARDGHTPQGRDGHTPQGRDGHTTLAKDTDTTQAKDTHGTQARDEHTPHSRNGHTTLAKDTLTTQSRDRHTTQMKHRHMTEDKTRQTTQVRQRVRAQDGHRHTEQSGRRITAEGDQKHTEPPGQRPSGEDQQRPRTPTGQEEQKHTSSKTGQRLHTEGDQKQTARTDQRHSTNTEEKQTTRTGQRLNADSEQRHTTRTGQRLKISNKHSTDAEQRHSSKTAQRLNTAEDRHSKTGQRLSTDAEERDSTQTGRRFNTDAEQRHSSKNGQRHSTKNGQRLVTDAEETDSIQTDQRLNTDGEDTDSKTDQRLNTDGEESDSIQTGQKLNTDIEESDSKTGQNLNTDVEGRHSSHAGQKHGGRGRGRNRSQGRQRGNRKPGVQDQEESKPSQGTTGVSNQGEASRGTGEVGLGEHPQGSGTGVSGTGASGTGEIRQGEYDQRGGTGGGHKSESALTPLQPPAGAPTSITYAVNPDSHFSTHPTTPTATPTLTLGSTDSSSGSTDTATPTSTSSPSPSGDTPLQGRGSRRRPGGRRRRPGRIRNRPGTPTHVPTPSSSPPPPSPSPSSQAGPAAAVPRTRIETPARAKNTVANPDSTVPLPDGQPLSSGGVSHRHNTGSLSDPVVPPPASKPAQPARDGGGMVPRVSTNASLSGSSAQGRTPQTSTHTHTPTSGERFPSLSGSTQTSAERVSPLSPEPSLQYESSRQEELTSSRHPAGRPLGETQRGGSPERSHTHSQPSLTHMGTSHTHTRVGPDAELRREDDKRDGPGTAYTDDVTVELPRQPFSSAAPSRQGDVTSGRGSQNFNGGQDQTDGDEADHMHRVTLENPRETGNNQEPFKTFSVEQGLSGGTFSAAADGKPDSATDKDRNPLLRKVGATPILPTAPQSEQSEPRPTTKTTKAAAANPLLPSGEKPHVHIVHPDTSIRLGTTGGINQIQDTHKETASSPGVTHTHTQTQQSPGQGYTHTHTHTEHSPGQRYTHTHTNTQHSPGQGQTQTRTQHSSRPDGTHTQQSPSPDRTHTHTGHSPSSGHTHTMREPRPGQGYTYTHTQHGHGQGYSHTHTQLVPNQGQTYVSRERVHSEGETHINRDRDSRPGQTYTHTHQNPSSGQPHTHTHHTPNPGQTPPHTPHRPSSGRNTHTDHVLSPDQTYTHTDHKPNTGQTHTHTDHRANTGQTNTHTHHRLNPGQTYTHTDQRPNTSQTQTNTDHRPNPGQTYTHTDHRPNPGQTYTHTDQRPNTGQIYIHTNLRPNTGQTYTHTDQRPNTGQTYTHIGHRPNAGETYTHTDHRLNPGQTNVERETLPTAGVRLPLPSDPKHNGAVPRLDVPLAKYSTPPPPPPTTPTSTPLAPTPVTPPQVPASGHGSIATGTGSGTSTLPQSPGAPQPSAAAVPAGRGRPRISSTAVTTVTVPAEADAHLPCVASGEPRPFLSWTKVSTGASVAQNTRIQRFEVHSNGTLIIRNTLPSDQGQYMCSVQNQYGEDRAVVLLTVQSEHPRVLNPRYRDASVHMGDSVDLECRSKGHPSPRVTWVLPDRAMVHTGAPPATVGSLQRVALLPNGTLRVTQTTYTDRGIYKCIASNAAGADSVTVRLHISALPPTIVQGRHDNVSMPEGSAAYLHCSAQGAPPPAIRWTTPDNSQLRPTQFVTGRNLFVFPNGTLLVRSVGPADSGRYECAATNAVGAAWRAISLLVIPAAASRRARITFSSPQTTEVGYGTQLLLDCIATGDPEPRIIWRTPSKKLVDAQYSFDPRLKVFDNGTLALQSVTEKDQGDYLCVARNKMGDDYIPLRVAVVTKPAKIVQKQLANQEVTYGSDLRVDCVASGLPNPKIQWALPDGTMINSIMNFQHRGLSSPGRSRRYVVFDNGTLYFNEVGMREEGDYTCYADNQVGKDEMKVRVKVVSDAPVIRNRTQAVVRVLYGGSATMSCEAKGEPTPTILWFSPASRTIPASSDKYRIHSDGTLVIQKVQRLDGGNYTCLARNSAGQARQVTRLEILVAPPTINGLRGVTNSLRVRGMRDQRKHLDCEATGTPTPRVTWILPQNVVLPTPYYSTRMTVHRNGTLEIRGLKSGDAAQLVCVAQNEGGEARLLVQLEVDEPEKRPLTPLAPLAPLSPLTPLVPASAPAAQPVPLSPRTETRPLTLGTPVMLNCSLHGVPLNTLSWFLPNGSPLTSGARFSRFYHRPDGTLMISNPTLSEGGVYRCVGRSAGVLVERSVALVPGRPPEISSRYSGPVSILNGGNLQLHCQAREGAVARLSWTLPSGVILTQGQRAGRYAILPNGTLSISQASVYDRGSYACRVANEYGTAILTVPVIIITYAPRITSGPAPTTQARRGVAVQLNCAATGLPRPEVAWETPDKTRLVATAQPRLFGNKYLHPQGALIIQNPSQRDSGFYRCTARNVIGVDSKGTYLQVL
ncbi:hypothetical protein ACEWY4_016226 [Coilia grayii]|uniref:Ig-like domain-containing protein n=1 Tax=Coilia grayii TaxID=363190 RepID=A0ABD1JJQ9_9TELE